MKNNNRTIERIRIANLIVFILLDLARYHGSLYGIVIILTYLHIAFSLLFGVSELVYIVSTRANPFKHFFSDWKVFMGIVIIIFSVVIIIIGK